MKIIAPPSEEAAIPFSRLIEGAHAAIRDGADPVLILSYLIWPPKALADRLAA